MSHSEALRKALSDAQRFLGELSPPPNEANTCDWVIRPLLVALGYENHEISAQAMDATNRYPDYTILPTTDHTWYLEAKAWGVGLDSFHVDQALFYAYSNGKQWVVLSNGREWRLFDAQRNGVSADRLVATAHLEDTDGLLRFLSAMSRESILAKRVAVFANERLVREYMSSAINNPSSSVIKAIQKTVKSELGGVQVTAEAIVDILNGSISAATSSASVAPAQAPKPNTTIPTTPQSHAEVIDPVYCRWKDQLEAQGRFEGKKVIVRKGSKVARNPVPSYQETFDKKVPPLVANGSLVDKGDHYELTVDMAFKTPSGASDFVLGASTNGWEHWKDEKGRPINQLYNRSKEEKWREGWSGKEP